MDRRGFFAAVAAAFGLQPLYRSLHARPRREVSRILNPDLFALQREFNLMNSMQVELMFHRDCFALTWPKIGDTIEARRPMRFRVGTPDPWPLTPGPASVASLTPSPSPHPSTPRSTPSG